MIDSRELRIANLILGVSDRIETVTEIRGANWIKSYPGLMKEHDIDVELKDCSGIELTEEWLLKFGFQRTNYRWLKYEANDKLLIAVLYGEGKLFINNKNGENLTEVWYVHQLQNFTYFYTGQELQLTT